jgi:hypothetical protein
MKRISFLSIALLLALAVAAWARSSGTSITVTPDHMKSGDTKTFTDDGRTITLQRDGDSIRIRIEGAGETKSLTITKENDGAIIIDRGGLEHRRRVRIVAPDLTVPKLFPRGGRLQTWFVCPKDHTTLRVPEGKENDTYKCPVDGTTMEKRKGHGFSFFFDEDFFGADEL